MERNRGTGKIGKGRVGGDEMEEEKWREEWKGGGNVRSFDGDPKPSVVVLLIRIPTAYLPVNFTRLAQ